MAALKDTGTSLLWLERNVVVPGCACDGRSLEVAFVDRRLVTPGGPIADEAASCRGIFARAQELHRLGNDIDVLAFGALLGLPLAPLQAAVDRDGAPLVQEAGGVLALRAPHRHVEVVGLVLPFARAPVLAARIARDPQLAHRGTARQRAQLGVGGQVSGQHDPVDVGGSHVFRSFQLIAHSSRADACPPVSSPPSLERPAGATLAPRAANPAHCEDRVARDEVPNTSSQYGALMPKPRVSSWKWWRMCRSRRTLPMRPRGRK